MKSVFVAQTGFAGGIAMWFWLALGSAVFAALTSILAKVGIEGVGSNLATAIRTMIVVIMAWGMVFITHQQGHGYAITRPCRWEMLPKLSRLISYP